MAQHLFGWTWRDDWGAWCPPTWPAHDARWTTPVQAYWQAIEQAGGSYRGSEALDPRGRPVVPDYRYGPRAQRIIWDWLHTQHTTVTLDMTGAQIGCQVAGPQHTGEGTGASLGEAVCAAALAYAQALTTTIPAEEHV